MNFSILLKPGILGLFLVFALLVPTLGHAQKPISQGVKSKKAIPKTTSPAPKVLKEPIKEADTVGGNSTQKLDTDISATQQAPKTNSDFSSGAIRSRRPFGAQLSYTPLSDFVLKIGGAVHYNLGTYWQFGGSALFGSKDLSSTVATSGESKVPLFTLSGSVIDIFARWHPMQGTFSTKIGLGYRSATANYRIES